MLIGHQGVEQWADRPVVHTGGPGCHQATRGFRQLLCKFRATDIGPPIWRLGGIQPTAVPGEAARGSA